eukprot:TRINITY_DN9523_c0_g1_i1.p1 TRINITY_DN9523_c0_g1~~TRINITY_DN9523_c0_g1_i1.p1  ORF type:complete len:419 (+),score=97.42 TRINITY_DN9523_c0_g1_i1:81-1259(+)
MRAMHHGQRGRACPPHLGWVCMAAAAAAGLWLLTRRPAAPALQSPPPGESPGRPALLQGRAPPEQTQLAATLESIAGAEVVWQLPPGALQGVAAFFHGCQHSATDFWPSSGNCPECLGLPEELRLTRAALSRGLAAVAISSQDRELSRCWEFHAPPSREGDVRPVTDVLSALRQRWHAEQFPLYVIGASSGGAFVQVLPHHLAVSGVVAQIMRPLGAILGRPPKRGPYPPLLFVHMPRDEGTAAEIEAIVGTRRVPGMPSTVAEVQIPARAVSESLLLRAPGMTPQRAQLLLVALRRLGLCDSAGRLHEDPRQSGWQRALHGDTPAATVLRELNDSLVPDASPLSELLNLAWAQHEIASDGIDEILAWLRSGGNSSLAIRVKGAVHAGTAGG